MRAHTQRLVIIGHHHQSFMTHIHQFHSKLEANETFCSKSLKAKTTLPSTLFLILLHTDPSLHLLEKSHAQFHQADQLLQQMKMSTAKMHMHFIHAFFSKLWLVIAFENTNCNT